MTATVATDALVTPEFVRSAEILVELHRLHAAGRLSGPDGDRLRDESLPLWCELSDEQQLILDGLSEDLHSFTDPAEPTDAPNPQSNDAMARMNTALKSGDWPGALAALRRWRHHISPRQLAHRRGRCWRTAGLAFVAAEFLGHAAGQDDAAETDRILFLHCVSQFDPIRARALAQDTLKDINRNGLYAALHAAALHPELVEPNQLGELFLAPEAMCLHRSTNESRPLLRLAAMALHHVLALSGRLAELLPWLRGADKIIGPCDPYLCFAAGASLLELDDHEAAIEFLDRAKAEPPLRLESIMGLAQALLIAGNANRAMQIAQAALGEQCPAPIRAVLLGVQAAATATLQRDDATTERLFDEAIRTDPLNEDLVRNRDRFRLSRSGTPTEVPPIWRKMSRLSMNSDSFLPLAA